jgi:hypothetical protein
MKVFRWSFLGWLRFRALSVVAGPMSAVASGIGSAFLNGAGAQSSRASAESNRPRGAGVMSAPLTFQAAAIRAGVIRAAESAGGWPGARVGIGTASETFSEAAGL